MSQPPYQQYPYAQQAAAIPADANRVAYLEQRVAALEARLPRTNLLSHRFMQRAWAVFGHYMVSSMILGLIVFVISMVISLVMTLIFGAGLAAMLPALQDGMSTY